MRKEGQGRVVFWVTTQLILLVVWVICLILGERFYFIPPILYIIDGIGVILLACGLTLAFLGGYELGDYLGAAADEEEEEFVTSGIFHRVRHPIYGGLLLAILGLTLVYASPTALVMVILMAALFYAKSLSDDVRMIRRFPEYLPYATRTRRFVPFIW
jgi:protein-S-isoprenylcysteine O-methyltransferase Ste14